MTTRLHQATRSVPSAILYGSCMSFIPSLSSIRFDLDGIHFRLVRLFLAKHSQIHVLSKQMQYLKALFCLVMGGVRLLRIRVWLACSSSLRDPKQATNSVYLPSSRRTLVTAKVTCATQLCKIDSVLAEQDPDSVANCASIA